MPGHNFKNMIASKELILLAAKASQLAYGCTIAEAQALGFSIAAVLHDDATDTQGIVLVNDKLVIVAFRGTESIKDWLTDVKVKKVKIGDCKFHSGFREAFDSIEVRLAICLNEVKAYQKTVIYTGHSLGGALAVLAGYYTNYISLETHVITFGQPRVADAAFRSFYDYSLGYRTTRVINGLDVICLSPLWLMGYRHCGKYVVFIDSAGDVMVNPDPLTKLLSHAFCVIKDWMHIRWVNLGGFTIPLPFRLSAARNHFMRDYLNQLETWAKQ
jgi:hypothetical protein